MAVYIADVDVVDVRVRLQCEDQTDEIRSREKHRDRIHQRPATSPQVIFTPNIYTLITENMPLHSLDMTQEQGAVVLTLEKINSRLDSGNRVSSSMSSWFYRRDHTPDHSGSPCR